MIEIQFPELLKYEDVEAYLSNKNSMDIQKVRMISKCIRKVFFVKKGVLYMKTDLVNNVYGSVGCGGDINNLLRTYVKVFIEQSMIKLKYMKKWIEKRLSFVDDDGKIKKQCNEIYNNFIKISVEIVNDIINNITDENIVMDCDHDGVHFRNGRYDLKTGVFAPRAHDMIITSYLDRDFVKPNEKSYKKVMNIFSTIIPEHEERNYILFVLGASLSGHYVKNAELLLNYGQGGTGKSTIGNLLQCSLPYMCQVLDNKMFEIDYRESDVKKTLAGIKDCIRFFIINEISHKKLNVEFLKTFSEGKARTTSLYKDGDKDVPIFGKLMMNSNHYVNFETDTGIERRLIAKEYKNRFTKDESLVDNKTYFYADENLVSSLTDDEKNAIFLILAEQCKNYYDKKLPKPCESLKKSKDTILKMNDDWQDFIDSQLVKQEGQWITKEDMLNRIKLRFPSKEYITLRHVVPRFTEKGIIYDKEKRICRLGDFTRGAFKNVRFRTVEDDKKYLEEEKKNGTNSLDKLPSDEVELLKRRIKELEEELQNLKNKQNIVKVVKNDDSNINIKKQFKTIKKSLKKEKKADKEFESQYEQIITEIENKQKESDQSECDMNNLDNDIMNCSLVFDTVFF